ncbi:putative ABC transporter ATP-binding protein [Candidatus Methanoplasma termitum]|uniref:ABC transporter ATP-binding protein n=1 Tax=Candidatus Methanoplasma termitum TaxID=1577791 RepID=A0A0A7LCI6_9ARCH|nr:ATP-binding cassette domain-containing protein [Candidatus Methanoplasma termitum]AIZ56779.1 putative ABC transporter ATP-binding protein [Candidatus Methanoplasma termitum]
MEPMMTTILETKNLSFVYEGGKHALKNVSVRIPTGCKVAFVGPNGAGKSTLFMHFNGILRQTEGEVEYNSKVIDHSKKGLIQLRKDVTLVTQNPDDQIFNVIVEDDVAFGPFNLDLPIEEVRKRVDDALKIVGMESERHRPIHHLSFGQKKRVAVASALAMRPKVLIMDEPTAGLDPEMVYRLYEIADEVNMDGSTVIISTHDIETAYSWANLVIVVMDGEVLAQGTPFEVFSMKDVLEKACLSVPMVHALNEFMSVNGRSDIYGRTMSTVLLNMRRGIIPGTLYILRPGYTGELHGRVGVYGSSSRSFVEKNGIEVQFGFNAIERCMDDILGGNDASIYLDDPLDHVLDRKLMDVAAHGITIPVEELR